MGRDILPHKWRGIIVTVSQEKWKKTQLLVGELFDMAKESFVIHGQKIKAAGHTRTQVIKAGDFSKKAKVPRQRLLKIQGFLNYAVRTYDWLTLYTKRLHNTIDGWRFDRDSGGWKMKGERSAGNVSRTVLDVGTVERGY